MADPLPPLRITSPAELLAALQDLDALNRMSVLRVLPAQAAKIASYTEAERTALGELLLAHAQASSNMERLLNLQALDALALAPTGGAAVYSACLASSTASSEWPVLVALLRSHPELHLLALASSLDAPAVTWAADLICELLPTVASLDEALLALHIAAVVRASSDVPVPERNAVTEAAWARELAGPYQARARQLLRIETVAAPQLQQPAPSNKSAPELLADWCSAQPSAQGQIAGQLQAVLLLDRAWLATALDGPQRALLTQLLLDLGEDDLLARHFRLDSYA